MGLTEGETIVQMKEKHTLVMKHLRAHAQQTRSAEDSRSPYDCTRIQAHPQKRMVGDVLIAIN